MNKMEKDSSKTTGGIRKVETIHSIDELHLDARVAFGRTDREKI